MTFRRLSLTQRRLALGILVGAAFALLLSPAPGGQLNGFSKHNAVARYAPGITTDQATAPPVVEAGGTAVPANPAPTDRGGGGAEQPAVPSGSASASAPVKQPQYTPTGALRRTGSEAVALTFDDGPDPQNTPAILDLLKEQGVKATFCLVGFRARDNPDLVRRIVADGHTLCNHSWQHLIDLAKKPPEEIRDDLRRTNEAIRAAVPGARIPYFRAPGGNFTRDLVRTARQMGMTSIYWQVDPRDWEHKKEESTTAHVDRLIHDIKRDTRPGAIVLSHDNKQPTTIEAYKVLLPWLKDRFQLIPLQG
jgi:peptidoglycan/xylan/chitin deacetylase (PgdA/CDA1 family)